MADKLAEFRPLLVEVQKLWAALPFVQDTEENASLRRLVVEALYRKAFSLCTWVEWQVEYRCMASLAEGTLYTQVLGRATWVLNQETRVEELLAKAMAAGDGSDTESTDTSAESDKCSQSPPLAFLKRAQYSFSAWKRHLSKLVSTMKKQADAELFCVSLAHALDTASRAEWDAGVQVRNSAVMLSLQERIRAFELAAGTVLNAVLPVEKGREDLLRALVAMSSESRLVGGEIANLPGCHQTVRSLSVLLDAALHQCEEVVNGVFSLDSIQDVAARDALSNHLFRAVQRATRTLYGLVLDLHTQQRRLAVSHSNERVKDFWRSANAVPREFGSLKTHFNWSGEADHFGAIIEQIERSNQRSIELSNILNTVVEAATLFRLMLNDCYNAVTITELKLEMFTTAVVEVLDGLRHIAIMQKQDLVTGSDGADNQPELKENIRYALLDPETPDVNHLRDRCGDLEKAIHTAFVKGHTGQEFVEVLDTLKTGVEEILAQLPS